ncbi:MAG: hypothetical protein Q8L12_05995 [Methylibium sp.]|jgi:hypothetical protein|uniref:hypothetical protein n=1 Tax=unclassified Methylibium TaxID=2633235 RepID=UPI0006FC7955|nr:hypothetical protein [Methylibium sp. Root1272]KQW65635.1 hypothetical protein ASC67_14860 [Methylibium sp. Root1272]MDP1790112.1 hypothetical protein [Methylibium sp.]
MTVFWWIVGVLLLGTGGTAAVTFALYVSSGEDRYMDVARAAWRWTVVFALGAFNLTIFKHIVLTLISIWRS